MKFYFSYIFIYLFIYNLITFFWFHFSFCVFTNLHFPLFRVNYHCLKSCVLKILFWSIWFIKFNEKFCCFFLICRIFLICFYGKPLIENFQKIVYLVIGILWAWNVYIKSFHLKWIEWAFKIVFLHVLR